MPDRIDRGVRIGRDQLSTMLEEQVDPQGQRLVIQSRPLAYHYELGRFGIETPTRFFQDLSQSWGTDRVKPEAGSALSEPTRARHAAGQHLVFTHRGKSQPPQLIDYRQRRQDRIVGKEQMGNWLDRLNKVQCRGNHTVTVKQHPIHIEQNSLWRHDSTLRVHSFDYRPIGFPVDRLPANRANAKPPQIIEPFKARIFRVVKLANVPHLRSHVFVSIDRWLLARSSEGAPLILLSVCVFTLALSVPRADAASDTAYYRGEINSHNNVRFFNSSENKKIQRLIINSPGGEVVAGIELGRWVFRNAVDVVVEHQCLSSCANYVFPSGRHKTIRRHAVVAWHGNYHHLQATGLWLDDIESRMARTGEDRETARVKVKQQMQDLVIRERDFFREIGVDQRLCWVGKMPPYSSPDYFTMSANDMLYYGVHSVTIEGDLLDLGPTGIAVDIDWISLKHQNP
jgi:hypothetical protein